MLKNSLMVVSLSLDIPRRWMCILSLVYFHGFNSFLRILWWIFIFIVLYNEFEVTILDLFQIIHAIYWINTCHIELHIMECHAGKHPFSSIFTHFSGFSPCCVWQCYHFSHIFCLLACSFSGILTSGGCSSVVP